MCISSVRQASDTCQKCLKNALCADYSLVFCKAKKNNNNKICALLIIQTQFIKSVCP